MSFLTLGIFRIGQQTQLSHFARSNRHLARVHPGFLFAVTLMPFQASLMAQFTTLRTALLACRLNIVALAGLLWASWQYAVRDGSVKADVSAAIGRSVRQRIIIA